MQHSSAQLNMVINFSNSKSKINAIAEAFSLAIMHEELRVGDNLPSINEASTQYKVSRDTVFKAYCELKERGLIDSSPMRGYFVKGEVNHILLLLDTYSPFKQNLYNRFAEALPTNYKVDLIFHQYNQHLFETIVRESLGRYSMYVVMNFSNTHFSEVLNAIPVRKLLLLDFGDFEKSQFSYICQDFVDSFYNCLFLLRESLQKYQKFNLVFPFGINHPEKAISCFQKYCEDTKTDFSILRNKQELKLVERGNVYLCFETDDMVRIIKDVDIQKFKLGTDVGLIAYNENPILEVIKNGITSISIDFGMMGEMAAEFVVKGDVIREYLPAKVTLRNSV